METLTSRKRIFSMTSSPMGMLLEDDEIDINIKVKIQKMNNNNNVVTNKKDTIEQKDINNNVDAIITDNNFACKPKIVFYSKKDLIEEDIEKHKKAGHFGYIQYLYLNKFI